MVRAKFRCESVTNTVNGAAITLVAVSGGSPENEAFFKWTPNAKVELATVNPEAAKQFVPGNEYYVDFSVASALFQGPAVDKGSAA